VRGRGRAQRLLARSRAGLGGVAWIAVAACTDWEQPADPAIGGGGGEAAVGGDSGAGGDSAEGGSPAVPYPRGFRVVGNEIHDSNGNVVLLRGVNRSGSEYQCTKNLSVFDGRADELSVRAMTTWNINAVRIPLNEACWLGISSAPAAYAGEIYKTAIKNYVDLLHRYALVPILDLHWAAPGNILPTDLEPMPNADHSPEFWADVARTFADDDGVIFEPYNEPFPDGNSDSEAAWQCWRDGCTHRMRRSDTMYEAAGMQALVDAIRSTGSKHVVLLGGVRFANFMTRWLEYKPTDPTGQLGAAWHVYNYNQCIDETCWNGAPADVIAAVPTVVTEVGQRDCAGAFIKPLMEWLDARNTGYLAWSWNVGTQCVPETQSMAGQPWMLITDYVNPEPNSEYARTFRDHLLTVAP
jgi:endoglucanase